MKRSLMVLAALAASLAMTAAAEARCPARVSVSYGDTLSSIARACGISVESLVMANPGLSARTLQAGSRIAVPAPALPSPQIETGHPMVRVTPSLVPPSTGGSSSSTVILPPQRAPVPQQHILRGFGDQPGQLPLPPGHSPPPIFQPPPSIFQR